MVRISSDQQEDFKYASEYFRILNFAGFFQVCIAALIAHYRRGDRLLYPLEFRTLRSEIDERSKPVEALGDGLSTH